MTNIFKYICLDDTDHSGDFTKAADSGESDDFAVSGDSGISGNSSEFDDFGTLADGLGGITTL